MRYYHLAGTVTVSTKGHSVALSSQLPRNDEECVKTSELHDLGPTATNNLPLCELLGQKQGCVNYRVGGKAFFRSTGRFGRSLYAGKANPYCICFSMQKSVVPSVTEAIQCNQPVIR